MDKGKAIFFALALAPSLAQATDLERHWYSHHLVCGPEVRSEPFADIKNFRFTHFTFEVGSGKKLGRLVAQQEMEQFPNFAKVETFQTFVRNGSVNSSEVVNADLSNLEIKLVRQFPARTLIGHIKFSRTLTSFTRSNYSLQNDGTTIEHASNQGVCWFSHKER